MRFARLPSREQGGPQERRGTVTATRFQLRYAGRWRRLYSDHAPEHEESPHFIVLGAGRITIVGVPP